MERLARIGFWIALAIASVMACLPRPPHTPLDQFGDKFEHMTAFGVLALLGAIGYRDTPLPRIAERLSFLGAMIELVQSIPSLHRDCDIRDWLADTAAILVVLLLVAAGRRISPRPADATSSTGDAPA